ncbi:DNA-binding protein [Corynebacterium phocae]|uniref:DNA-binding protein n=1 Tax=Corynebacterium phocae TaxID=161895 RepID=A0A1L7D311_9CORY|nr:MarR family transcriptional regulator [Corynebacterium phocae]APT92514.1 DNA-binding protein [Corynebacterium phocae]
MLAVHARYRGQSLRRAALVQRSAQALSTLDGVDEFKLLGVEDICSTVSSSTAVCEVVLALLADGDWAVGIGVTPALGAGEDTSAESATRTRSIATAACKNSARAGQVYAKIDASGRSSEAADIAAAFTLLGFVLNKRTIEGREATALVRSGLNQNEAARELGISKQAMSQRLHAAGWNAEQVGWQLVVNVLERANHQAKS